MTLWQTLRLWFSAAVLGAVLAFAVSSWFVYRSMTGYDSAASTEIYLNSPRTENLAPPGCKLMWPAGCDNRLRPCTIFHQDLACPLGLWPGVYRVQQTLGSPNDQPHQAHQ